MSAGNPRVETRDMNIIFELSSICAERNPDLKDQRKRFIALLKAGADVHAADKNGVRFRNLVAVDTLIEYGADVNRACRKSGSTPLHRAVTPTGAPGTAGKRAEARRIVTLLLAAGPTHRSGIKKARHPGITRRTRSFSQYWPRSLKLPNQ
jgi:uncharacterized protein